MTVLRTPKLPHLAPTPRRLAVAALAVLAAAPATASAQAPSVRPGHTVSIFHNVDFVAATGYGVGTPMRVEVFRGPHRIGSAHGIAASTAEGAGLEVNHGTEGTAQQGDCWDSLTPDVRPGDRIVVTGDSGQDTVFVDDIRIDEVVSGTTPDENVYVRGVARHADGTPIPIAALDSGEVRADGGGTRATPTSLSRLGDPAGDRWEAVYAAPSYGVFRGSPSKLSILTGDHAMGYGHITVPPPPVVQLVEGQDDVPGPAIGCEASPAAPASAVTATDDDAINLTSGVLEVSGVAAAGVTGVDVTLTNGATSVPALPANVSLTDEAGGKAWTARFTREQLELLGDGVVTATAGFHGAGPATHARTIVKDLVAPAALTASPPAGTYQTGQRVQLSTGDAEDVIRFTRDGSVPTAASPRSSGVLSVPSTQTIAAFAIDAAGNAGPVRTFAYEIVPPAVVTICSCVPPLPGHAIVPPPPPALTTARPASRPYLRSFGTLPRIRRSVAARSGIRVVMRVGGDARVVRVRLFRKLRNGRRLALGTTVRSPRRAGVFRVVLNAPRIRRALRPGQYEIEGTPGASRTSLGTSSRFRFTVING